jgi:choline dehydrogenase
MTDVPSTSPAERRRARLSRRRLFRDAGAVAGLMAASELAGCAADPAPSSPIAGNWQLPRPRLGPDASFEYVIVGSGAGGGPLAANLSRAGRRVLLIEAGSADAGGANYAVPVFHAHATEDPAMRWDYFVKHWENPPAADSKYTAAAGGILYPRAGTLGGCTAHHAMITVYPDDADWNHIAQATGDPSWSSDRMRRYFQRLERCTYREPWQDLVGDISGHGYDGWLPTSRAAARLAVQDRQLIDICRAAAESVGIEGLVESLLYGLLDPNDKRMVAAPGGREGLFLTPLGVGEGRRYGPRDYVLATAKAFPENLTVLTEALVTRVLFDGTRAVGVEFLPQAHAYRADPNAAKTGPPWETVKSSLAAARASREVILAAGAFNSPQLLMLSGIGPAEQLKSRNIPVVIDRPGVGQNLQDRYEVTVVSQLEREFELLRDCRLAPSGPGEDPCFDVWERERSGIYATNGVVIGIIRRSRESRILPDLYIFGLPGTFRGYYPGYAGPATSKDHFCWAILKGHTNNTAGEVRLRSADPRDTPEILFRYFEESNDAAGEDLDSVVAGVEFARAINRRLKIPVVERVPGPQVRTPAEIADFVRREAWGHHASCSNKMGPASDMTAVVDSRFRVYGATGLRVVDASVFPRIPGLFIVTAVYMISEKASDVILAEATS